MECDDDDNLQETYASVTARQNPNLHSTHSPGSITPGQRLQNRTQCKKGPILNEDEFSSDITDMEFEEAAEVHCNSKTNNNSNNSNNSKHKQQDKSEGLQKFLGILLPFIMRLFLSQSITDKIECFMEIGKLWNFEMVVDSMLQSLNMTSIANLQ